MADFNNRIESSADYIWTRTPDGRDVDHQTFSFTEFLKILISLSGGAAMLLRGGASTVTTAMAKVRTWVTLHRS